MRRAVLATILISGCSFQHGFANDGVDARPTPYPPGHGDAAAPVAAACHSSLPDVRLCLDFEPPAFSTDDSGLAHVVDMTTTTPTTRGTQGAADLTPSSSIQVEPRSDLDTSPELAMEMWVEPHSAPSDGDTGWLLSSAQQYGLWFDTQGLHCGVSSLTTNVSVAVPFALMVDQWTHVACTYDGATLKLYVDGNAVACNAQKIQVATSINSGIHIMTFDGAVDDVHLYGTAPTAPLICQLATGGTACNGACPPPVPR